MRTREIKKQFWLNEEEAKLLSKKAYNAGLTESDLLRFLIRGYEPREKPDDRFYESIKQLRLFGINLNQIARKANSTNHIDKELFIRESENWHKFVEIIKDEFLRPKKVDNENLWYNIINKEVMCMKYIHYGSDKFDIRKFKEVENDMFLKPKGGLWASPVNSYIRWFEFFL